jgi:predicted amidohydrolase YtcJ
VKTLYRRARLASADGLSALLVVDGRIAWLGQDDESPAIAADSIDTVDLDGALVLPGFVDAHVHVTETGLLLAGVDLSAARSVTAVLDQVAAAAAARPGRPVLGHGWDELQLAEGRPPTAAELDRAGGGLEVYLSRVDVHSAVVSGALAVRAGVTGLPGWEPSGRVERDAHHAARHATRFDIDPADRRELQLLALRSAAAAGITELHEMSAPHVAPEFDLVSLVSLVSSPDLGRQEPLGRRPAGEAAVLPGVVPYRGELAGDEEHARQILAGLAVAGLPGSAGRPGLAGLAGDLMVDGSIGSRTAAVHQDYTDAPGHRGHLYLDADQVRDHVVACARTGLQAGFHVIGDAAVDTVLAGFSAAASVVGLDRVRAGRHRIEHLEAIDQAGVLTAARLGLIASVQPAFDAAWGGADRMYAVRLGPARAAGLNPFAAMATAGVTLAFGSDSPVTPFAPWEGIRAALLHRNPDHRLPIAAALAGYTTGGRTAGSGPGRGSGDDAGAPVPGRSRGAGASGRPGVSGLPGGADEFGAAGEFAAAREFGAGEGFPADRGDGRLVVGGPATFTCWHSPALHSTADDPLAAVAQELRSGAPVPTCVKTIINGQEAFSAP